MRIIATAAPHEMPPTTEQQLIQEAQAGDADAAMALVEQYAPLIRNQCRQLGNRHAMEDSRAIAALSFVEAINEYSPERNVRLGVLAKLKIRKALLQETPTPLLVSNRSWQRYLSIMRAADQNVILARSMAPDYSMDPKTFDSIHLAAQSTALDPDLLVFGHNPYPDADDRILVTKALSVLTDDELEVVELTYGLQGEAPMSRAEVVYELTRRQLGGAAAERGQSITNRMAIQRLLQRALGKMRTAIGAGGE